MQILYEDNHIIAVNKKPSELVQGDRTGDRTIFEDIKQYIKEKYNKPGNVYLGLTHRLDRPVSGVVIFGRTSKATARINELFKNKSIQKKYWAIVKEPPKNDKGTLEHYLIKNNSKNKSYAYDMPRPNAKKAVLDYDVMESSDNYYLIEIQLHTGRHHQIRTQLSKIGSPVKGDLKYGFPRSNQDKGISLHARTVSFIHPVKKEPLTIVAPPPNDPLWEFFLKKTNQLSQ